MSTEPGCHKVPARESASFIGTMQDVPEMLLIRIPHAEVNGSKSGGDVSIDTELTFDMVDPESYDAVFTVDMLTKDSAKYN